MGITTLEPRPQGVYLFQCLFTKYFFSSTARHISAAVGKTGAAIGTQAFTPIQNSLGKRWTFIIAAICGIVGNTCDFLLRGRLDWGRSGRKR
jgi:Na+/melibiose symporter-like transporter